MSKFWKNTGAEGKMCVNNIQVTPSVQGALQKVSYLFPVGESDVSFTINKSSDGTVKIIRGAFSDAKSPLAHGGPGPTIPKSRIVQIMHDIMDGDAGVCDTSIEKVAEAISRYRPVPVVKEQGEAGLRDTIEGIYKLWGNTKGISTSEAMRQIHNALVDSRRYKAKSRGK